MGRNPTTGYSAILGVGISADAKNPTRYAVYASTGGLSLPDRDYYLDAKFAEKKTAYEAYVAQMLTMIGWDKPAESAKAVVAFETQLAEASWTRAERRDRDKTYNPMTLAELQALTPGFAWNRYLVGTELPRFDRVVVTTNTAFPKFAKIYADTPLDTLKAWQAFKVADGAAPMLSKRFVDANYEFRNKTLAGQPEQKPRWKRGVAAVNNAAGRGGRPRLRVPLLPAGIQGQDDRPGRQHPRRPEGPPRHAGLDVARDQGPGPGQALQLHREDRLSRQVARLFQAGDQGRRRLRQRHPLGRLRLALRRQRLNGPVDKSEWGMTPQTVNAYYNSVNNEIVFPAAILQAPFFHPDADPAVNYGGIGGVIGHEISHGFDDQGRKSDGKGVLRDWWTPADAAKFKAQADKLGAQYGAFEPLPGAKVNGALTMGENIGDMGGLAFALEAYHASLDGKPAPVIDGFTGDQRVYLGWAQVWRSKIRDDALRQQVVSDPHSPAYYRVNGTIRNQEGWYKAFDVKPGDKLYVAPADRVDIW
jgi:putative endopeptidase